jgi:hypothetical protein
VLSALLTKDQNSEENSKTYLIMFSLTIARLQGIILELILDNSCTLLRIKAIRPSCVLEMQGVDRRTIHDHSKKYAPYHLPNLDPTINTLTWIPPLDYPCQVCQRIDNVNQMLLCDNCNGGYHLFCLKSELTQVPANIWYCSSCFHVAP